MPALTTCHIQAHGSITSAGTVFRDRWFGIGGLSMKRLFPLIVIGLLLAACGGSGPTLDARVLQLNLTYSFDGPTIAIMNGGDGAAAAGSEVECRLTGGDRPRIGASVASETGSFEMDLNLELLPQQLPDNETFRDLNETVECRSGDGSWTNPLRQPVLQIE